MLTLAANDPGGMVILVLAELGYAVKVLGPFEKIATVDGVLQGLAGDEGLLKDLIVGERRLFEWLEGTLLGGHGPERGQAEKTSHRSSASGFGLCFDTVLCSRVRRGCSEMFERLSGWCFGLVRWRERLTVPGVLFRR